MSPSICLYLALSQKSFIRLNFEFFMARRILRNSSAARKVARPALRISVWAIALGVWIMILAVSTGNGLRKAIQDKVNSFGGEVQILNYQPNPVYEQTPLYLSDSVLKALKDLPALAQLQPYGRKAGILRKAELFEGAVLKGIGADYRLDRLEAYRTRGRFPRYDGQGYQDSIILSETLARRLDLELGESVEMFFVRANKPPLRRKFIIGACFQTDFESVDQAFLIGDLRHVQRLNQWEDEAVGGYEIWGQAGSDTEVLAQAIRQIIPYDYDALSAADLHPQLFQWLALFDVNIIIILSIIIIVSTVNMAIALLILIMERTQMIGLLKALGAGTPSIQKIFLINAGVLILKGLAYGNLLGLSMIILQDRFQWLKLDPEVYYVSAVSVDLNPWPLLGLNLLTLIVCLLCLWLPSWLISQIRPARAIRFD